MFITANHCKHYLEIYKNGRLVDTLDPNEETIIAIPGGMGYSHTILKPDLLPLSDEAQIIFYDPRSTGRTEQTNAPLSISLLSEDLIALITALNLEKVLLYAHSGASSIALDVAQQNKSITGLILANPILMPRNELVEKMTRLGGEAAHAFYSDVRVPCVDALMSKVVSKLDPVIRPEASANLLQLNFEMCLEMLGELLDDDVLNKILSTRQVCTVLLGELDPYHDVESETTALTARRRANLETVVLNESGHDNLLTEPERTRELVRATLERCRLISHAPETALL